MVKNFFQNSKTLLSRPQTSILSAAFIIMVAYALSALLGLLRNRLLAAYFFGSRVEQLDVYFAAFVIPDTLFQLLVIGALSAAFIPVFSSYFAKNRQQGWYLASSAINLLLCFFAFLAFLVFIFARSLSRLIAPTYSPSQLTLLTHLIRLMLTAQFFFAASSFLTGILQSQRRFLVPAFAPIVYNLGIIFGIVFLSPLWQIYGPAVGVVFGAFLHFLIQLPLARQLGFRYRPVFDLHHPGIRQIRKLMLPRTLTLAVGQVERFVAVIIGTSLAAGSLAIFNFARQLYLLPINLFGTTLSQASFPTLSSEAAFKKLDRFRQTFTSSFHHILFFTLPFTAILFALRVPAVRLAFGAKQFPWRATVLTARTLALFALSIVPQAVIQLLIRVFHALQDTKTPFIATLLTALANLLLSFFLTFKLHWGVLGLAAAVSLSTYLHFVLLLLFLLKKAPFLFSFSFLPPIFKMLTAGFFTALSTWLTMKLLDRLFFGTTRTLALIALSIIASFVGLTTYLLFSRLFKLDQLRQFARLYYRLTHIKKVLVDSEKIFAHSSDTPPSTQTP